MLKSDVSVSKNYLDQKEIEELNRIVTMYLDYAENQAARQIPMKMKDWIGKLDGFLQFNDYSVLKNSGSISADIAKLMGADVDNTQRALIVNPVPVNVAGSNTLAYGVFGYESIIWCLKNRKAVVKSANLASII